MYNSCVMYINININMNASRYSYPARTRRDTMVLKVNNVLDDVATGDVPVLVSSLSFDLLYSQWRVVQLVNLWHRKLLCDLWHWDTPAVLRTTVQQPRP